MAKKEEHGSFITVMEARYARPGYILCSVADLFKSEWVVQTIMSRVEDRFIVMELKCGNRLVRNAIAPDDFIERKVTKATMVNSYAPATVPVQSE